MWTSRHKNRLRARAMPMAKGEGCGAAIAYLSSIAESSPAQTESRAHARSLCTSENCPMAHMLSAMPNLCDLEPPKSAQSLPSPEDAMVLQKFGEVRPYGDRVWGPAGWTALEADILSLPDRLDEHEFCMFRIYLALRARYLPCGNCARHFEKALRAMPNDGIHRTRAGLLRWLCGVHNDVNRRKQRVPLLESEILSILHGKADISDGSAEDEEEEEEEPAGYEGADEVKAPINSPAADPSSRPRAVSVSAPASLSSQPAARRPLLLWVLLGIAVAVGLAACTTYLVSKRRRAAAKADGGPQHGVPKAPPEGPPPVPRKGWVRVLRDRTST